MAREAGDTEAFIRATLGFDRAQFLSAKPLCRIATASHGSDGQNRSVTIRAPGASCCAALREHICTSATARTARNAIRKASTWLGGLATKLRFSTSPSLPFLSSTTVKSVTEANDRTARLDELKHLSDEINDDDVRGRALSLDVYVSTELGNRVRADQAVDGLEELGTLRQHLHNLWVARSARAMMTILDGRFANAEALAGEALSLGRQTHGAEVEGVYGMQMFTIRREQSRLSEVAPVMKHLLDENPDETTWLPGFALIAADLGYREAAQRRLDELARTGFAMPLDAKRSASLSFISEVAVSLGDAEAAQTIYDLMLPYKDMTITAGVATVCFGAASRYLGMLSAVLGDFPRPRSTLSTHLR